MDEKVDASFMKYRGSQVYDENEENYEEDSDEESSNDKGD